MLSHEELKKLLDAGAKVFGSDGEKIGTLGHIHLDERTGIPDFVAVHTGFFGGSEKFVPLTGAEISNGQLYVKFPKDLIKDAPDIDPDRDLSAGDEDCLYHYYSRARVGILGSAAEADSPQPGGEPEPPAGPGATAPEEHTAHVVREHRTVRVAGIVHDDFAPGRPRLRKYVVTEPGKREPSHVDDARFGERLDPADLGAEAGRMPIGQIPEVRLEGTSEQPETRQSGGADRLGQQGT
ncbi:PRC-barrel domain-containing protein [Paeniglutamicibacter sp. NPDC012692]|uniref:PRC-barrel domain-containing protein n=1 Tax=Paeniglutamicibacter sp. NPDC012692 TaxID=3364388 RepID=UPI0036781F71